MNTDKIVFPEIITGVWYLSKETIFKMTKSDDLDLEEVIKNYKIVTFSGDKDLILEAEAVINNFEFLPEIHFSVTSSGIEMITDKTVKFKITSLEENGDEIRIKGKEDDGTETDFLFKNVNALVTSEGNAMNFVRDKADLLG